MPKGITETKRKDWTIAEENILIHFFPTNSNETLLSYLPGRTLDAIASHARILDLHKTPERLQEAASRARRAKPRRKASFSGNPPAWTEQEEAILKEYYATAISLEKIAELLPGRTPVGLAVRAKKLGLSRPRWDSWTAEEKEYLRKYYPSQGTGIAEKLGRTMETVRAKARMLGVRYTGPQRGGSALTPVVTPPAPANKPVLPAGLPPIQKRATEKAAPIGKAHKELEKPNGLAQQLRELPYNDPLRLKYQQATRPGTKPTEVPRTMAQLKSWTPSPSSIRS